MFKYFLFDLDGTLTDPFEGITNSIVYALGKFGITVDDKKDLIDFIGPPLVDSFGKFYGFDSEKSVKAVEYYREYFSVKALYENSVYEDVVLVLSKLKSDGKILVLATSKPEEYAVRILEKFDLGKYFDFVAGATMDNTRSYKADVIAYAIESCGIEDKTEALMIGDRKYDVEGAKINGLKSAGVTYGYGSRAELVSSSADYILDSPLEILNIK